MSNVRIEVISDALSRSVTMRVVEAPADDPFPAAASNGYSRASAVPAPCRAGDPSAALAEAAAAARRQALDIAGDVAAEALAKLIDGRSACNIREGSARTTSWAEDWSPPPRSLRHRRPEITGAQMAGWIEAAKDLWMDIEDVQEMKDRKDGVLSLYDDRELKLLCDAWKRFADALKATEQRERTALLIDGSPSPCPKRTRFEPEPAKEPEAKRFKIARKPVPRRDYRSPSPSPVGCVPGSWVSNAANLGHSSTVSEDISRESSPRWRRVWRR